MERSKLKNIVILLLVVLNAFFLILVVNQNQRAKAFQEAGREATISLLQEKGFSIEEEVVPWEQQLLGCTMERNQEQEQQLARLALGEIGPRTGGTTARYESPQGSIQFFQTGRFVMNLEEGAVSASGGAVEIHAAEYLQSLGMDTKFQSKEEIDANLVQVTVLQLVDKVPVFSSEIVLEYQDGALQTISGMRLADNLTPSGKASLGAETLLTNFLELILSGNVSCTEIRGITPGYVHASETALTPIWRIETDTGIYELNCLTGKLHWL